MATRSTPKPTTGEPAPTVDKSAMATLAARLPPGWRLTSRSGSLDRATRVVRLSAPDGRTADLKLLAVRSLTPRAVLQLRARHLAGETDLPDLVIAPYLSAETRRRLWEAGMGYADATGNVRLSLETPGLYVEVHGAERNPAAARRPERRLAGPRAGRLVRTLCTLPEPLGVRELAERSTLSAGYVSRLLAFLDREGLVERDRSGRTHCPDWPRLLRYWAEQTPLPRRGERRWLLAPRGIGTLRGKLPGMPLQYAVTGSMAAERIAPVAPSRLAMLYVEDLDAASDTLALRPVDAGANVLLIEPKDRRLLHERLVGDDGICYAPLPQVVADLLSAPGRGPAEAEALIDWMMEHEEQWRGRAVPAGP